MKSMETFGTAAKKMSPLATRSRDSSGDRLKWTRSKARKPYVSFAAATSISASWPGSANTPASVGEGVTGTAVAEKANQYQHTNANYLRISQDDLVEEDLCH